VTQQHEAESTLPYKAAQGALGSSKQDRTSNTVGMGTSVYSSCSDSLDERPPWRSSAAIRSLSKPSKPQPSERESSEDDPGGGGGGRGRLAGGGVPRASFDAATAAAAAAAAAANVDCAARAADAAGGTGGGDVRSTVVCISFYINEDACLRFVACALRPRFLLAVDRADDDKGNFPAGTAPDVGFDDAAAGFGKDRAEAVAAAAVAAGAAAVVGLVDASAVSSTNAGGATGGDTDDLVSATTVASSSAATFPVAETSSMADKSATSPTGGGATTSSLLVFCASPSAAADASLAFSGAFTLMPSVASIFSAW